MIENHITAWKIVTWILDDLHGRKDIDHDFGMMDAYVYKAMVDGWQDQVIHILDDTYGEA